MHLARTARFSVIDAQDISSLPAQPVQAATPSSAPAGDDEIAALNAQVTKQASLVKEMKKKGVKGPELEAAIRELQNLRATLSSMESEVAGDDSFNRKAFEDTLVRKMFVIGSFEIHGGVKGLFDLGPPACALKANILDLWRKHFVLEENMLEMECTNLTPANVLKTSGHVEKFTDKMVKDLETGECFRADKLLEDAIETLIENTPNMPKQEVEHHRRVQIQADAFSHEELHNLLQEYNVKGVDDHELSKPFDFNLMFETRIGPEGTSVGYLRPETAQGLFVNFRRLLNFNGAKMPFAAAQIGLGFRNEIAPRAGLLRVREFCMAEIEHFVNPNDKSHPKFDALKSKVLKLFDRDSQLGSGKPLVISIGEAVAKGIVNNQTLGYFMTRTQFFMEKIGMDPARLRFRQHLQTEMAHYATDCWDLEIQTSYGWIECVGHADRACYDLKVHAEATNTSMTAAQRLPAPKEIEVLSIETDRRIIGRTFKKDQKQLLEMIAEIEGDEAKANALEADLKANGSANVGGFTVTSEMVSFKKSKKIIEEEKFLPSVIEPSFGIGRILYALLEHSFFQSPQDEQRVAMRFNSTVAPLKCNVYNLQSNSVFGPFVQKVSNLLTAAGLSNKVDSTGQSIGRRYARADEVGTPFGVTVDFDTIKDDTVTLRERDSQSQIRLPAADVPGVIQTMVNGGDWKVFMERYPVVHAGEFASEETKQLTVLEVNSRAKFSRPHPSLL